MPAEAASVDVCVTTGALPDVCASALPPAVFALFALFAIFALFALFEPFALFADLSSSHP